MRNLHIALALCLGLPTGALAEATPSPPGARVYFIEPADGAVLTNPVRIRFGLQGMGVAPAGVEAENTGHHHLLLDVDPDEIAFEDPLPSDDRFRHFGGGQTETVIDLPPGAHTLQLLLGDHVHTPHGSPVISERITVTVR